MASVRRARAAHADGRPPTAAAAAATAAAAAAEPDGDGDGDGDGSVRELSRRAAALGCARRRLRAAARFPALLFVRFESAVFRLQLRSHVTYAALLAHAVARFALPPCARLYFNRGAARCFIGCTADLHALVADADAAPRGHHTVFAFVPDAAQRPDAQRAAAVAPHAQCAHQRANSFVMLSHISPCTFAAVHALKQAMCRARHTNVIASSLHHFLPRAAAWAVASLGSSGPVPTVAVERICAMLTDHLRSVTQLHVALLAAVALRAALSDPALVDALRKIAWHEPVYTRCSGDVHVGVLCACCSTTPIVGCRYKATVLPSFDYDLCAPCQLHLSSTECGSDLLQLLQLQQVNSPFQVHNGIACSTCGAQPILGSRFIAMDRTSFDLCANCYRRAFDGAPNFVEFKYVLADGWSLLPVHPTDGAHPRFLVVHSVHNGRYTLDDVCAACDVNVSTQSRYCATDRPNYSLCDSCFADDSSSNGGYTFVQLIPVTAPRLNWVEMAPPFRLRTRADVFRIVPASHIHLRFHD